MRTEVYSWRVSSELKSDLERTARRRGTSVAEALRQASVEWLKRGDSDSNEEAEQRRLRDIALHHAGAISDPTMPSSENVSQVVRDRVRRRNGR